MDALNHDMLPFEPSPDRFKININRLNLRSNVLSSRVAFLAQIFLSTCSILIISCCLNVAVQAQDDFGDAATDPVKLFERGQSAHARGELEKAIEFYEQAIKVRPEFPEAEFQRGSALASLGRLDEAEEALKKAITLKKNWALPHSAMGALLMRQQRDKEAVAAFRQALAVDPQENVALRMLSELRLREGDPKEALDLAQRATRNPDAPSSAWVGLAIAQKANGNKELAKQTLDKVLSNEPNNVTALIERSDLSVEQKAFDSAIVDLGTANKLRPNDKAIASRLAHALQQTGRLEEAAAVAKSAGIETQVANANAGGVIGTPDEISAANSDDVKTAREAIEKLIQKNPKSAMLLAKLGATYRKEDPTKSLELYRRASELQPTEPDYAVGYAAALVQARRFAEAAHILKQVVKHNPKHFSAHANLATALYELKLYSESVTEFEWLLAQKPDLVVTHYFIATAHDFLGEYPQALESYEMFLAKADAGTNQLEIEKVKLRLPTLRRQSQLGEGVKKKP